jgi:Ti-type conjugative transfer relaxase TraA
MNVAIAFARLEFVKRSEGKNACFKSAYIAREKITFLGNKFSGKKTYNFSSHGEVYSKGVILPEGTSKEYLDPEYLWNTVEKNELRRDSQVAFEFVLALPDDKEVSGENRVQITKEFIHSFLTKEGLASQYAIHYPSEDKKNWHAHILVSIRKFNNEGNEFEKIKDRELIRKLSKTDWGNKFASLQNEFFKENNIDLRVDPNAAVAQIHLGPKRMVRRAFELFSDLDSRIEENKEVSKNPSNILISLTEKQPTFTSTDFERYLEKYVDEQFRSNVRKEFWSHDEIVELVDVETKEKSKFYTTKDIKEKEEKLDRISSKLFSKTSLNINISSIPSQIYSGLNSEQQRSLYNVLAGGDLSLIQGYAGTGKSYLLKALYDCYSEKNIRVRALAPDNSTAQLLREKGLQKAETVHAFLYSSYNGKRPIKAGKEVWVLDEATKLGANVFSELFSLAYKSGAKLVLSGDVAQISSISRGEVFKDLLKKFSFDSLDDIQRQNLIEDRKISEDLARGRIIQALGDLKNLERIQWSRSWRGSLENLAKQWLSDRVNFSGDSQIIIVSSNKELAVVNELCRSALKEKGEIDRKEIACETDFGKLYLSSGDTVEFREKLKDQGVLKGDKGKVVHASKESIKVSILGSQKLVEFEPRSFGGYHLGYAKTYYRVQGETVDRAYVSYSPVINKEHLYVGMTRAKKRSYLFVNEKSAKDIDVLNSNVERRGASIRSLEGLSTEESLLYEKRMEYIKSLKEGDLPDKIKGTALSLISSLKQKVSSFKNSIDDKKRDDSFYSFHREYLKSKDFEVWEVDEESASLANGEEQKGTQVDSKVISFENSVKSQYNALRSQAKSAYLEFKEEDERKGERKEELHSRWKKACGERNKEAFDLKLSLGERKLKEVFGEDYSRVVLEQSNRHSQSREKFESQSFSSVQQKVREGIDVVLSALFQESPFSKTSHSIRYGKKGSLSIDLRAGKEGNFNDFEESTGGGPIQLIQKVLGVDAVEAKNWVHNLLGGKQENVKHFSPNKASVEKEKSWSSLIPPKGEEAPDFGKLVKQGFLHYNTLADKYEYRDLQGNLLFINLRFHNKKTGDKVFLPVSYGIEEGQNPCWKTKGFNLGKKPLYNLHELGKNSDFPVLIVEGEKTANAAKEKYGNEIVCMTWSGGSGAVESTDWSPLKGKDIIIWPDCDEPGKEAAEKVINQLKKVGAEEVHCLSNSFLSLFPKKWDLADNIPEGKEVPSTYGELKTECNLKVLSSDTFFGVLTMFDKFRGKPESELEFLSLELSSAIQSRVKIGELSPMDYRSLLQGEAEKVCSETERVIEEYSKNNDLDEKIEERLRNQVLMSLARGESFSVEEVGGVVSQLIEKESTLEGYSFTDCLPKKHIVFDKAFQTMTNESDFQREFKDVLSLLDEGVKEDKGKGFSI